MAEEKPFRITTWQPHALQYSENVHRELGNLKALAEGIRTTQFRIGENPLSDEAWENARDEVVKWVGNQIDNVRHKHAGYLISLHADDREKLGEFVKRFRDQCGEKNIPKDLRNRTTQLFARQDAFNFTVEAIRAGGEYTWKESVFPEKQKAFDTAANAYAPIVLGIVLTALEAYRQNGDYNRVLGSYALWTASKRPDNSQKMVENLQEYFDKNLQLG